MKNDLGESVDGMAGFPGIGCLQALEAIKIASAVGEPLSGRMLLFDAFFHGFVLYARCSTLYYVEIRGRSMDCEVCGENSTFTQQKLREFDYENFTRSSFCSCHLVSIMKITSSDSFEVKSTSN
ncbi:hypothetical protein L6164_029437 [Bauhinia variegata]|nr:hypothetical protein L6164_029437 [Bauhinia variegata]